MAKRAEESVVNKWPRRRGVVIPESVSGTVGRAGKCAVVDREGEVQGIGSVAFVSP